MIVSMCACVCVSIRVMSRHNFINATQSLPVTLIVKIILLELSLKINKQQKTFRRFFLIEAYFLKVNN